jgi:formylglycine-generating enzyme required for sulfatase activity
MPASAPAAALTVLLAHAAIDPLALMVALRALTADATVTVTGAPAAFTVHRRGVTITCREVMGQAPDLDQMIQTTRADHAALTAAFAPHDRHLLCTAAGGTGISQTTALFHLAAALQPMGALGLIHTPAWQCFTSAQVARGVDPKNIAQLQDDMAKAAWCNLIPFIGKTGTWWATKGNHVFGVPDFALWNRGELPLEKVQALMLNLFDHVKQGAVIRHGENLAFPPHVLRAGPVDEFPELISGGGETIALRFANDPKAHPAAPPLPPGVLPAGAPAGYPARARGAPASPASPAPAGRAFHLLAIAGLAAAAVVALAVWGITHALAHGTFQPTAEQTQQINRDNQRLNALQPVIAKWRAAAQPGFATLDTTKPGLAAVERQRAACWKAYTDWLAQDAASVVLAHAAEHVPAALADHDLATAEAELDHAESAAQTWEAGSKDARQRLFTAPFAQWGWDQVVAGTLPPEALAPCIRQVDLGDALKTRVIGALTMMRKLDEGGPIPPDAAGQLRALEAEGMGAVVGADDMSRWHARLDGIRGWRAHDTDLLAAAAVIATAAPIGEDARVALAALALSPHANDKTVTTARAKLDELSALGARLTGDPATMPAPMPGPEDPAAPAPAGQDPADLARWHALVGGDGPVRPGWRARLDLQARQSWAQGVLDAVARAPVAAPVAGKDDDADTGTGDDDAKTPIPDGAPGAAGRALLALAIARANAGNWTGGIASPRMVAWSSAVRAHYGAFSFGSDAFGVFVDLTIEDATQRFRLVLPTTFMMGCDDAEAEAAWQYELKQQRGWSPSPQWVLKTTRHAVVLTRPYWLADTPSTEALVQTLRNRGSGAHQTLPAGDLGAGDCDDLLGRLSGRTGAHCRLPTEAEWECACRAGTTTALWTGGITYRPDGTSPEADAIAWYYGNAGPKDNQPLQQHAVREHPANPWGLYDMNGLKQEWCSDIYQPEPDTVAAIDPTGPTDTNHQYQVRRGASWNDSADSCRAASRVLRDTVIRSPFYGMRIAIDVDLSPPITATAAAIADAASTGPATWGYTLHCHSETGEAMQPGHDFTAQCAPIIDALKAKAPGVTLVPATDATRTTLDIQVEVEETVYGTHNGGFNTVNGSLPDAVAVTVTVNPAPGAGSTWPDGKSWNAQAKTPEKITSDQVNTLVRPTFDQMVATVVATIAHEPALAPAAAPATHGARHHRP